MDTRQTHLVTFLGITDYQRTTYRWPDGQEFETALFPTVLPRFFPDAVSALVFVTAEAEAKHGAALREQWPTGWKPEFVPIPSGATTEEVWQIFDAIVAEIPRDSRVVFDITHAFRSIPLVSVLAVAYLWSTRNVQLHALVYGAFEAKVGEPPVAPVFDLTPMVNLLEWLSAVERFRHHLDGTPLRELLHGIQRQAHTEQSLHKPRKLQSAGSQLEQLTDALLLGRVREVLREVPRLRRCLGNPVLASEAGRWAKPLALILQPIGQLLEEIGQGSELDLSAHHRLARLYAERRLFMPAITVFREWVVSSACRLAGFSDAELVDEKRRGEIEKLLGARLQEKIDRRDEATPAPSEWIGEPAAQGILDVWNHLPHIRNDVDHAGMKKEDKPASTLIKNIRKLVLDEPIGDDVESHQHVKLDVSTLYAATGTAKLAELGAYEQAAKSAVRAGAEVTLTGPGPVWLYLKIGHALHGIARSLRYDSPVTGPVLVFDHSPD